MGACKVAPNLGLPIYHRQWATVTPPSPRAMPATLTPKKDCLIVEATAVPLLKLHHLIETGCLLHGHSPYDDHVYRHPKTREVLGTSTLAAAVVGYWGVEAVEDGFSPSGAVCRLSVLLGTSLGDAPIRSACGKHDVLLIAYIRYLERQWYWTREQIAEWLKSKNF